MAIKSYYNSIIRKYKLYRLGIFIYKIRSFFQNILVQIKFANKSVYKLMVNDAEVKFDTKDSYSKKWFYLFDKEDQDEYENAVTNYLEQHLKSDSTFLDIGAHIGYYTCLSASILKDGKVHSFEVDENCHRFIEKNIKLNAFANTHLNVVAVSDSDAGEYIRDNKTPDNKLSIFSSNSKKRKVPSIAIDDYISTHGLKPDFIKIDVEGAECKVLDGMSKTLGLSPLTLLVEVHVQTLKKMGYSHDEVINTLMENGFEIYEFKRFRDSSFEKVKITQGAVMTQDSFIIAEKG